MPTHCFRDRTDLPLNPLQQLAKGETIAGPGGSLEAQGRFLQ